VSIDINETFEQLVLQVLDNKDLSGVIVADDIADVVREIVDSDHISDNIDYSELASNVEERLDLDYTISCWMENSGYIQSDDVGEYVVNELDNLLSDYSYENTCRTWRGFIQAVEDIIDHKVVQADDAHVEDEGTVRSVVRDEMKRMLGQPIRDMIIEELATHAIRKLVVEEINKNVGGALPMISKMIEDYTAHYVQVLSKDAFQAQIRRELGQAFMVLANESSTIVLPERELVLNGNGTGA
jgi:hypothetical protein